MALKRLSTEEMVQLSGPWVTEGTEARDAILAVPEMAGVLPKVEAAHGALHGVQPTAEDPRLARLQEEAAEEDVQHDTLVRGMHMYLTSLALLSGSSTTADSLLQLRDFLLPDGLETMQKSYRAEAGAGDLLKTRLSDDAGAKKQLKKIPVLEKHLGQYVDMLLARAKRLGELEDERARIVNAPASPSDGARLMLARNQWIRAVNALVANADLAELDGDKSRLVFGALRLVEKKADRRVKLPEVEAAPEPAPEKAPA